MATLPLTPCSRVSAWMAPVSSILLLVVSAAPPPSSVTCPSGVTITTPHPPGPGLRFEAPSVNTTICCSLITPDSVTGLRASFQIYKAREPSALA